MSALIGAGHLFADDRGVISCDAGHQILAERKDGERMFPVFEMYLGDKICVAREILFIQFFIAGELLVGNRLYQIAILQYGKAIGKKELKAFYDSFELKL